MHWDSVKTPLIKCLNVNVSVFTITYSEVVFASALLQFRIFSKMQTLVYIRMISYFCNCTAVPVQQCKNHFLTSPLHVLYVHTVGLLWLFSFEVVKVLQMHHSKWNITTVLTFHDFSCYVVLLQVPKLSLSFTETILLELNLCSFSCLTTNLQL